MKRKHDGHNVTRDCDATTCVRRMSHVEKKKLASFYIDSYVGIILRVEREDKKRNKNVYAID